MPWIRGSACFREPLLVTLDPKVFGSTVEVGGEASLRLVCWNGLTFCDQRKLGSNLPSTDDSYSMKGGV